MDEAFTLNGQETADHSEFGIAADKHAMIADYTNNDPMSEKLRLAEEENERLRNNMKKLKKRMIQTSQMIQLYTNAQEHLQQSVQREFEAQKQIEALRHQIEELIVLSQPQVDRLSALESEIERLTALVLEKDIQIKSKESLINQLKAEAQKAEELAQMEKHLENTTKETEVLKKEIKLKTIQYKKWAAKTETLDAKIKDEQAKIAELEKILANRKEPNEIEREILRMQYSIEERDRVICEKEREISVKDSELEKLRAELDQAKVLLQQAQDEAKQNQENYEMKIIRLEQRLKVKRHENFAPIVNNTNPASIEEDILQMPIHKPIEAPTDLIHHSMDITTNHNNSMMELFGSDIVMEDEPSDNFEQQNDASVVELSPDNSSTMQDVTEVVEEGTVVPPKKTQSNLAKKPGESETEHVQRVVTTFLGFTPLNHTYLQASRHLKNYSSEDIAKTIFHTIEQQIQIAPNESINYKRTLFFASHLSKAKPGFLDILTELIHAEVLANFQSQFSELFFNIATLTHQYHFIYEIVFNWLAQQSSLEDPTILRLAVKYLSPPTASDDATEPLFWTLCIIVYRNEIEDLKEEVAKKVNDPDVDKKEDDIIFKILQLMVEPSSTQFYAMVLECIIKFGGQQILSKILANACKLNEPNNDVEVQKSFHNILKAILTKNTFLFTFHRKLPFWLQLIVAQVLVENIIEAEDNYEIFAQRLSLWREFLDETQKNSIPEELTNYLNVVENFIQKKY